MYRYSGRMPLQNDGWTGSHHTLPVFGPLLMNLVQAWIQDQYLKRTSGTDRGLLSAESLDLAADAEGSQRDTL